MNTHVKTLLTLAVLAVPGDDRRDLGVVVADDAPSRTSDAEDLLPDELQPGDRVSAPKVTVSVFNASDRVGLAESTMSAFEDQGFGAGDVGNAPKDAVVHYAQIWTEDRHDPAVRLVASRLGPHASIVAKKHGGPGVIVMVGPDFQTLVQGKQSTKVTEPVTVCSRHRPADPSTRRASGRGGRARRPCGAA